MTGLVTLNTDEQWTAGGQVVLLERSAPEARLEKIYGVTVVARLPLNSDTWENVTHTSTFAARDTILVMGSERDLERFATLT